MSPPRLILEAEEISMAGPSAIVLLILFVIFTAAIGMYWWLIVRESADRRMEAIREWARGARFRVVPQGNAPPAVLEALGAPPRVMQCLSSERCTLVRCHLPQPNTVEIPANPATTPLAPPRQWHLLICSISSDWTAAALRPANATRSLCDLLALPAQLSEGTQRFTVCSADRSVARSLGRSSARGLLPPDIGLLLLGKNLLIDFSDRPFDAIEFNRMIAVADQIKAHLPNPA